MTRELVEKLKNNIEETRKNLSILDRHFWFNMSRQYDLSEEYIREFSDKLDIEGIFHNNVKLTSSLLEDFYKPLYLEDKTDISFYSMFLLRRHISDDAASWLIRNTDCDFDKFLWKCGQTGRSNLFWSNIFLNPHISEEFKYKHRNMKADQEINIGDKVHTNACKHGVVGGKDGDKFIILNTDRVSDTKFLPLFVSPENVYKGWE